MKPILLLAALIGAVVTNTVSAAPLSAKVNLSAEIEISTCAIGTTTLDLGSTLSTGAASSLQLGDVSSLPLLTNCTQGESILFSYRGVQASGGTASGYSLLADNTGTSGFERIYIGPNISGMVGTRNVTVVVPDSGNVQFSALVSYSDPLGGIINEKIASVHAISTSGNLTRNEQNGTIRGVIPITITYQ